MNVEVDKMRLTHNLASLRLYYSYENNLVDQNKSIANISSGTKINSAMDNPTAMSQSERLNMQLKGLQVANQNSQDTVSLLQTAEGGLDQMDSMLQRIRQLAVQAGNDTNSIGDKSNIQSEITQLIDGFNNLAKSNNMNGVNLLASNSGGSISSLIGSNVGESVEIPTYNLETSNLKDASGNALSDIDVTAAGGADKAMNVLDSALQTVNSARSKYGAIENRLTSTISNSSDIGIAIQTKDSDIVDTDMASEMLNFSKDNILIQAGIAMMAQTNKFPQDVLSILSQVKSK